MSRTNEHNQENAEPASGRFLGLLRPYSGRLALVLFLLCLLATANMALPKAIQLLLDDVFMAKGTEEPDEKWTLLFLILGGLILIFSVRNLLFYNSRMQALRVSEDLCFSLRKRLFEHLQQLSMKFYHSNQPGRIGARVMDDTFKIQSFIQDKLPIFLLNFVTFQILVVILFTISWSLALTAIIVLPLQFMTYRHFRLSMKSSSSEAQENLASAYANLIEKFLGMEVVKGFSAEGRETVNFNEAIDASRKSQIRSQRHHFAQKVTADLLVGAGTIMLLGFGAFKVIKGPLTPGVFMMFFSYVAMLYPAVLAMISGAGHLSKATASIDRIFEMLDIPALDEGVTEKGALRFEITEGSIEFRNVSFSFDGTEPFLEKINFRINRGEHIAITGPSGSGKSTMMSLLPRLQRTTTGDVLIDDHNVSHLQLRALRSGIATAFQEVFLFNTTILENLRYAKPKASMQEIVEVCHLTGADEVIRRLPDGFQTRIGEYGGELSRGEKQRITLARALLKDCQILILDEATASIDSASAKKIIERVFERMGDRTVIMVTHDASLMTLANRVISLNDGRVCFDGSSESFLSQMPPESYALHSPGSLLVEETASAPVDQQTPTDAPEDSPSPDDSASNDDLEAPIAVVEMSEAEKALEVWEEITRFRKAERGPSVENPN